MNGLSPWFCGPVRFCADLNLLVHAPPAVNKVYRTSFLFEKENVWTWRSHVFVRTWKLK